MREKQFVANRSRQPTCGVDGALVSPFQRRDERQGIVHVVSRPHGEAGDRRMSAGLAACLLTRSMLLGHICDRLADSSLVF